jgi:hypothetical protein
MASSASLRTLRPRWTDRLGDLPPWMLPAAALLLLVAFLLPVLHAPFFSDDITNSQIPGYRTLHGDSTLGLFFDSVRAVLRGGRPEIFGNLPTYPVYNALGDHPTLYHGYVLALTVLDAALLYGLLRRLRAPAAAAALVIVLATAWLQLRIYHDSLISFAGLVQIVLALVIGSLWCFVRWLERGRGRDLALALGLFFVACGVYEIAYPLCVAYVALALAHRRGRAAVRAAAPFLGVAVVFALASVALRHFAGSAVAQGYTVGGGSLWAAVRTYAVQLVSPLPDMSIVANPEIGGRPTTGELFAAVWRGVAVAGAVAALGLALLRAGRVRWAPVVALGLGLYFAPPVMLAVAAKYQTELDTSRAYLPVLIQVFGLATLAAAALGALVRLGGLRSRAMGLGVVISAALFAGLTGGVTGFNNVRVVGIIQPDRAARQLIEASASHGAFGGLPSGSSVFFTDRDMTWQGPVTLHGFYYVPLMLAHRTGRVYDARVLPSTGLAAGTCPPTREPVQATCAPPNATAAWARVRLRRDGGTVIVAPLDHPTRTGFPSATAARLVVYRGSDDERRPGPPQLVGRTRAGARWTSAGVRWRLVRSGPGWSLYAGSFGSGPGPVASSLDDPRAFVDFLTMPPFPERARLFGTRRLLP